MWYDEFKDARASSKKAENSCRLLSINIEATFLGAIKLLSCIFSNTAVELENGNDGGKNWFLSVIKESNNNKDINFEAQNDDSWLFNAGTARTMKTGGGSPFQRLHAVPINSYENSDGSCMPHEVIPQAWMENIRPTPTNTPEPRDKEPQIQTKTNWDVMTLICVHQ